MVYWYMHKKIKKINVKRSWLEPRHIKMFVKVTTLCYTIEAFSLERNSI